jgi:hypothetical protein
MAFSGFATLGDAQRAFQIASVYESFVLPEPLPVSAILQQEIAFALKWVDYSGSEEAICENLIYPILKDVWKHYPEFQIWSHVPLKYSDELSGVPDYFLARRSDLGSKVVDMLYLLVAEAKKDDFERAWGQCLAAMVTVRKLNDWPQQVVLGMTTNGRSWQFGKLEAERLTLDPNFVNWLPLEQICAAVNFMFDQCRRQLRAFAGAA